MQKRTGKYGKTGVKMIEPCRSIRENQNLSLPLSPLSLKFCLALERKAKLFDLQQWAIN